MLITTPMLETAGLDLVGQFDDEEGDRYGAFVDPARGRYVIGWQERDGGRLCWFNLGGFVSPKEPRPVEYVRSMALATLEAIQCDAARYASGEIAKEPCA